MEDISNYSDGGIHSPIGKPASSPVWSTPGCGMMWMALRPKKRVDLNHQEPNIYEPFNGAFLSHAGTPLARWLL